jgi:hypothetical protein
MKGSIVAGILFFQASIINAFEIPFEIPFKLPFGLNFRFGKADSPELFALHKDLINIPSVTGSEHDVGIYIANYLQRRNYTVERIPSFIFIELFNN